MAGQQPKKNIKILVVENEVIIGEDLRARLESLGYAVLDVVGSGEEAIRTVDSERPDLILMAITLKGEIDGIDAAEIVRARFDIPVVFITAHADKDRLERAKPALPFGYVLKPFHEKDLRVTVEMALFVARADSVRRDAEKALKAEEARYRLLAENSNDAIWTMDEEFNTSYCSPAVNKILGYTPDEIVRVPREKRFTPGSLEAINCNIQDIAQLVREKRLSEIERCVVSEAIAKDGRRVWIETSIKPMLGRDGRFMGLMGSSRDITASKKAEKAVLVNQQRMEALLHLSRMDDSSLEEVAVFALEKSVSLTGSKFGVFIILREDESLTDRIFYTDEARKICRVDDFTEEFRVSDCGLWAEAVRRREPFMVDDYSKKHPAKKGVPDGHIELTRLLSIPIIHDGRVVAAAVVANKEEPYGELDTLQFRLFMEGLWRILERRQAREKIVTSLREKEILLREVHHRVKNNLQVVSSLLNLQANKERDARVVEAIGESQSRIAAMAMVHESIYQSESLASINLKTYLEGLIRNLEITYSPTGGKITFELSVRDNIELTMDRAAPCGLVMNELIVNAVKHAFPGNRAGRIVMEGAPINGRGIRLSVRDDGIGLPENFDWNNVETLGLSLVKSLVEFQLLGSIEIRRGEGAEFLISFPV